MNKNGLNYIIREVLLEDVKLLVAYVKSISGESDNLTFGLNEFIPTEKDEKEFIKLHLDNNNCHALVAVLDNKIIGMVNCLGGDRKRLIHAGEIGISVSKSYWRNGVANALMNNILEWAKSSPITKINLSVKEDNVIAINLYKKLGFKTEGLLKRGLRINNKYYDLVMMGKIID